MNNHRINQSVDPVRDDSAGLRIRPASRAVIMSPDRQILLVRFEFPAGQRWALPGGGLDPGEDHLVALRRELIEELGFTITDIGPHIWTREHHFPFLNGLWDGQRDHIHLLLVDEAFAVKPQLSEDELRAEFIHEIRWWPLDEIGKASHLTFVPRSLYHHLVDLIANGPPVTPVDVEP